jgi:hypothetical protein
LEKDKILNLWVLISGSATEKYKPKHSRKVRDNPKKISDTRKKGVWEK